MKLYTEEQVRLLLNEIFMLSSSVDEAMDILTPIELPSDEELRKLAKEICKGHQHAMRYNSMLVSCFKMSKKVIHQILNQNK